MKRRMMAGLSCCILSAAATASLAEPDLSIVPGERVGPITANATERSLAAALPDGSVRRELFSIGEDFFVCGTAVFAGTENEVFIHWANRPFDYVGGDEAALERCRAEPPMEGPRTVSIRRPWDGPAQQWRTAEGMRIGMTLNELAGLLGTPLLASVCSCDYGGIVFRDQEHLPPHLTFWIDFPSDVEEDLAGYVIRENDFELSSADIPAGTQAGFPISRIDVEIEPR